MRVRSEQTEVERRQAMNELKILAHRGLCGLRSGKPRITRQVRKLLAELVPLADQYDLVNDELAKPQSGPTSIKLRDDRDIVKADILNLAYLIAAELKKPPRKRRAKEARNGRDSAGQTPGDNSLQHRQRGEELPGDVEEAPDTEDAGG